MSFNARAASEQGLLRPSHKLSTKQGGRTMISSHWAALDRAVFKAPIVSGIYRLSNRESGKSYVGQACNLKRRLGKHLMQLKQGLHAQPVLRAAFAKHGPEVWVFEVLERCPRSQLTEREQHHVEQHGALTGGYNCAPIRSGVQVTEAFRAIAQQAANKFHARVTDQERSEIALRAAATRRERAAAARRSAAAQKAWATRKAKSGCIDPAV